MNGKHLQMEEPASLVSYLESIGVNVKLIAVALNGTVLRREDLPSVTLTEGDEVEVVRAVGGG
ncbi:MAG: sulfur carrier protein ThiS [SAR202 cluster bacterium]|nr:sulfur carrier protein ThiS [SAR202 cluster bacterium]